MAVFRQCVLVLALGLRHNGKNRRVIGPPIAYAFGSSRDRRRERYNINSSESPRRGRLNEFVREVSAASLWSSVRHFSNGTNRGRLHQTLHGIAVVCLKVNAGARHDVKTE